MARLLAAGAIVALAAVIGADAEVNTPTVTPTDDDSIHFVFSTDCRAYQSWQSEVLAYSFELVQQKGKLTRIVSGCNTTEQRLQAVRRSTSPRLQHHFTPKFVACADDKDNCGKKFFPFYNK